MGLDLIPSILVAGFLGVWVMAGAFVVPPRGDDLPSHRRP